MRKNEASQFSGMIYYVPGMLIVIAVYPPMVKKKKKTLFNLFCDRVLTGCLRSQNLQCFILLPEIPLLLLLELLQKTSLEFQDTENHS